MIQRKGSDKEISQAINERLAETLAHLPQDQEIFLSTHFVLRSVYCAADRQVRPLEPPKCVLGSPDFCAVIDQYAIVWAVVFGHTHRRFEKKNLREPATIAVPSATIMNGS